MRRVCVPAVMLASWLLAGCVSSANDPTLTLLTDKSPEQYVDCLVPKLKDKEMSPVVSGSARSYRVVVSSKVAVDTVLETHRAQDGGNVYLYERQLLASTFKPSSFERAAQECL
ncbi:hypothetical protein D3C87_983380 [compost metagenome]|uniref:Lipoprotein n=1 Tax=Pseudomonas fluorescens TaxID=294 RepID=A0A8H2RRW9_PSEFL|nr:hypothetical protein [Pseudomonas fluorescens]CAG8872263.1 hypothetical protein PS861_04776 [Pseudomonas fluorescens]VVP05972.1 hypothetical protein PS900_03089 [Pseudomonas fluorescens]VVP78442.1 hypothetical protein PS934_00467 [Pseudomonas fluorescens]